MSQIVQVFREVWRVLRDDGTLWLNLGDSFATGGGRVGECPGGGKQGEDWKLRGKMTPPNRMPLPGLKPKDLVGIPWRVAFALQADGWWLRSDIIWCLSGGAKVYARTQKGEMPIMIKDLVRLDPSTVKLWTGEKWTQALGWSRSPDSDDAIEIELRSGERIGCTRNHIWPTYRGHIQASALKLGDVLHTCQLPEGSYEPAYLAFGVSWLIGLFLAEGSWSNGKMQFAGHADEVTERMATIRPLVKRFGGSAGFYSEKNSASIVVRCPPPGSHSPSVRSRQQCS